MSEERKHTLQLDEDVYQKLLTLYDMPDEYPVNRLALKKAKGLLRDVVTLEHNKKQSKPVAQVTYQPAEPLVANVPVPVPVPASLPSNGFDVDGCWPPSPAVMSLMYSHGRDINLLEPCRGDYEDRQTRHLEEKKFWIRAGYLFEGMSDPETALEHALGDIEDRREWDSLPDRAKSAHRVAAGKFRNWLLKKD